jgi:hypothetical protein
VTLVEPKLRSIEWPWLSHLVVYSSISSLLYFCRMELHRVCGQLDVHNLKQKFCRSWRMLHVACQAYYSCGGIRTLSFPRAWTTLLVVIRTLHFSRAFSVACIAFSNL